MSAFDLIDLPRVVKVIDTLGMTRDAERSHMSTQAASARFRKPQEPAGTPEPSTKSP